jgi:hypothetical protein
MATYLEPLPASCPPATATSPNDLEVFRLVPDHPPVSSHFMSHAALGIAPPGVDECRARSCSVFTSLPALEKLRKLPRLKTHKAAVRLVLPASAGMVSVGHSGHCDWWIFAGFDAVAAGTVAATY